MIQYVATSLFIWAGYSTLKLQLRLVYKTHLFDPTCNSLKVKFKY